MFSLSSWSLSQAVLEECRVSWYQAVTEWRSARVASYLSNKDNVLHKMLVLSCGTVYTRKQQSYPQPGTWNGVKCWNFMTEEALNKKSQLQCFFRNTGCHLSFEKSIRKGQEWNDTEKGRVYFLTPRKSRKKNILLQLQIISMKS